MKINMNYMRMQMTASLNQLGMKMLSQIKNIPEDERERLLMCYENLASYIGGLNCVYTDGDELFSDISEEYPTLDIGEKYSDMMEAQSLPSRQEVH